MGVDELFATIQAADEARAASLVEANPNWATARHPSGASVILWALYHRCRGLAEKLARMRGELDVFEAAALGDGMRLKALLGKHPALAQAQAEDGFSPLGLASFFAAEKTVTMLIAAGADVDRQSANPMQVAPLHSAAAARHTGILRRLLAAGAAPNPRQHGGWTPLHAAAQHGDREMVALLLEYGADKQSLSDDGKTPHDLARAAGHGEVAAMLT
jgi:ankyrin repeat protein